MEEAGEHAEVANACIKPVGVRSRAPPPKAALIVELVGVRIELALQVHVEMSTGMVERRAGQQVDRTRDATLHQIGFLSFMNHDTLGQLRGKLLERHGAIAASGGNVAAI